MNTRTVTWGVKVADA